MVGIPDRAGRCVNCKHRKIKCDLSRPACTHCRRLNLHCKYALLQKGDIFVNRTTQNPFAKASNTSSLKASGGEDVIEFPGTHGKASLGKYDGQPIMESIAKSPSPIPEHLVQLFSNFISLYLPKENQNPTIPGRTPASWVQVVAGFELNNPVLNSSLAALCTAQLGAWKNDKSLENESVIIYASALQKLRTSLKECTVDSKAMLASIIMLLTCETFANSTYTDDGWASHVRGGSQILQVLGPSVQNSVVGRQLFARIRTICIFEACRTRSSSIAKGLEWQLSLQVPGRRSAFDDLEDVMIQLPCIMEAFDSTQNGKSMTGNVAAKRDYMIQLIQSCFELKRGLLAWYDRLRVNFNGELFWAVPAIACSPADDNTRGRVFPLALRFPKLSVAQLVLLYWSTMIMLYRTILDIQRGLRELNAEDTLSVSRHDPCCALEIIDDAGYPSLNDFGLEEQSNPDMALLHCPSTKAIALLASNICQSVEYCYHSKNGTLGPQSTVFPLWTARQFYASQTQFHLELTWCSQIKNMTAPESRFDCKLVKL